MLRPADEQHPFGYGLEANIWALFACLLMLIGTSVALYNGTMRLIYGDSHIGELLKYYNYIAITLIISIALEVWAVLSASKGVIREANVVAKIALTDLSNQLN
ncbi:MAG: cation transporter [Candidatus Moduliflexus flocculans]|nr:cation transporter [Candidatus Moduliflexus flocculans]